MYEMIMVDKMICNGSRLQQKYVQKSSLLVLPFVTFLNTLTHFWVISQFTRPLWILKKFKLDLWDLCVQNYYILDVRNMLLVNSHCLGNVCWYFLLKSLFTYTRRCEYAEGYIEQWPVSGINFTFSNIIM